MIRKKLIYSFGAFVIGTLIVMVGCSPSTGEPDKMPEDFNFSLSYGVGGNQKVDTFHNIVVKDLVQSGIAEVNITLSNQEMKEIYNKMMDINIMEIDIDEDLSCASSPATLSIWKIEMGGETKRMGYGSVCQYYPDYMLDLAELEKFIHEIIINKEEYQELPDTVGGYA
ncbi:MULTISPECIES: hypothetical protein [Bacillaceae]|nr:MULTISPECIES: hypothetical protein [Bacillaceae]